MINMLILTHIKEEICDSKDALYISEQLFTPKNKGASAFQDCKYSFQQSKDSNEGLIFKDYLPQFVDNWYKSW